MSIAITHNLIKLIIADQKAEDILPLHYISRSIETKLHELSKNKEVIVLTGLRRCGKSVLLHKLRIKSKESDYYFNFEDDRLVTFTVADFQTLLEVFIELYGVQKTFYFDEIQNITGWEMFIRRLYNSGNKIYISGSNANLFSEELGTRLTGRYIPVKIYPISFQEYLFFKNKELTNDKSLSTIHVGQIKKVFAEYCNETGGIPGYINNNEIAYLHSLYESILYRDIVVRYKITNDMVLKKLVYYLASNCSKEFTFNSLKNLLQVGSGTTIADYCYYLENSYLCFLVNRYSDSLKVQNQSPKKVYFIDPILAKTVGFRISEDKGRILENLVFLELKRRNLEIYYYSETKECDFILRENNRTVFAIQVSCNIADPKTKQREVEGLIEAMQRFSLKEGLILTEHEEFQENYMIENNQVKIRIKPIWKWLIEIT